MLSSPCTPASRARSPPLSPSHRHSSAPAPRTPDHSSGGVTGTFDGTTLLLSRDTGLETIQRYRLTVTGDRFTGTYVNEGKYQDRGTFEGSRNR